MKLVIFSLLFLFFVSFCCLAAPGKIDSLENELAKVQPDTVKISLLNNLATLYWGIEPDKSMDYAKKALALSEKLNYKTGIGAAFNNIGVVYADHGDYVKALAYYHKSLEVIKKTDDKKRIAFTLGNMGSAYLNMGNYEKALEHYLESLKMKEELGDKRGISVTLNNIGSVYQDMEDYDEALQYHERSMKIKESLGDKNGIDQSLNNLGSVFPYWKLWRTDTKYISCKVKEQM